MTKLLAALLLVLLLATNLRAQGESHSWYRGNLHTHSLWSDGNDFPEMICDWYARHGYQFLGLSDHNILSRGEKWIPETRPSDRDAIAALQRYQERFGTDWVETRVNDGVREVRLKALNEFRDKFEQPGKFLLLEAEEITDSFQSLPIHVNANNIAETIRPQGGDSVRATIANNLRAVQIQSARTGQPILAHLNHPNFGWAVTAEDMAAVVEERFFEVFNGHPSVNQTGDQQHASVEHMWDIANTLRISEMRQAPLYGLATDDSHNYFGDRGASPGRGWVMVRAEELTAPALINAIYDGDFYASTGVTLEDVKFDKSTQQLEVRIAAEEGVTYITEFLGTTRDYDRASTAITDAEGKELPVTRQYSDDIGRVLGRADGAVATYKLTGNELYVRARITSSKAHPNPSILDQVEQAWTQPVGWQRLLK